MPSTISKHPRTGMATLRNSVGPAWLLWPEGRSQASNVRVVVGDLRATPNLYGEKPTFPILQHPCHNVQVVRTFEPADHRRPPALKPLPSLATAVQRLVQSGFCEVAITSTLNGYTVPRDRTEPSSFKIMAEGLAPGGSVQLRHF